MDSQGKESGIKEKTRQDPLSGFCLVSLGSCGLGGEKYSGVNRCCH